MTIDYVLVFKTAFSTLGFLFPAWPLIVLAPIQRRRHVLWNMLVAWFCAGLLWIGTLIAPTPLRSWFIPDPWNTIAYFAVGAVLLLAQFGRRLWQGLNIWGKALRTSSVEDLLALSAGEFESMTVELYSALGHKAKRTGAVGDHGVDVEVQAANGEKWIVQCKRWRGKVGEPVVRDFYGVLHHEKADRGAIITTGGFTDQARR